MKSKNITYKNTIYFYITLHSIMWIKHIYAWNKLYYNTHWKTYFWTLTRILKVTSRHWFILRMGGVQKGVSRFNLDVVMMSWPVKLRLNICTCFNPFWICCWTSITVMVDTYYLAISYILLYLKTTKITRINFR